MVERRKTPRPGRQERDGLRGLLSENLGLKLFSLVLGMVIFLAVRSEKEVTTTVAMRLLLQEPDGLINTFDLPPEVMVRVTGTSARIRALGPDSLAPIEIDVTSLGEGLSLLRIREDQLGLPPDLKVLAISPSAVNLRLEPRLRKTLPVQVPLLGRTATGYSVDSVRVEPSEVEVEGPRRELRNLRAIHTAPIDLGTTDEDLRATVGLEAPGPRSHAVEARKAEVQIHVVEERVERTVRVAVEGGGEGGWHASARLRGPKLVMEALDASRLRGRTERAAEAGSRGPLPVRIENLPEGVELVEPLPTLMVPTPARPP